MNQTSNYIYIVFGLLILGIMSVLSKYIKQTPISLPYQKKQYLLSLAERSFFEVLKSIIGDSYYIFPQVNLDKIIQVQAGTEKRMSYFHRMNQYSVDFLICDKANISPMLAIELDDSSHYGKKRQERDAFVNSALEAAKIQVLREPCRQSYNAQELGTKIREKLTSHE